ncbi:MAG TPA: TonB family protein [Acidobacteriaceae bacterium]|jgi:TonB family protein
MAIIEVPPPQSAPPEPPAGPKFRRKSSTRYEGMEADELLHLIDNLEDERSRSRVREGIYISLLAHVLIFLFILFGPRYILHQPKVISPFDVLSARQKKELTYMSLPPDALKNIRPKNPQALSDKNRVAQSPHPTLDKKTLEQLQAMRRAGPPLPKPAPEKTPAPQQAAPQPVQPQPAPAQPRETQPLQPKLEGVNPAPPPEPKPAPTKPNFNTGMSAGEQIRQAARGASQPQEPSGDYGAGRVPQHAGVNAGADILSDTMGVDFGPYMQRVIAATYRSWIPLIPESARPPLDKSGKVGIEFVIAKDGSVQGMKLKFPSGDVSLDRAAWGGITGASPYPPLPKEFKGPYLALRFGFYYNIPEDNK